MLISTKSASQLKKRIESKDKEIFCSGLFLSARWFVLSQSIHKGLNVIVMPNKEAAEYCSSDLYSIYEEDVVFFLPESGKNIERSNYKSSLIVQRTSAIESVLDRTPDKLKIIVTYPEAITEPVSVNITDENSKLKIKVGDKINYDRISEILFGIGFERVDFVSLPGQYAIRGSIVDIFSYSNNRPYRISFWGNEVESIHIFEANTQLSVSQEESVSIISNMNSLNGETIELTELIPEDTVIWLDSSDMYSNKPFFDYISSFQKVFIDTPVSKSDVEKINFSISPQPIFNKNFDLLKNDIRSKLEKGFKIYIYGEKESQLKRLSSILSQEMLEIPEFISGKNIHSGFIDNEDKICCYSDHEIFDRFHRVSIRRSVEKSEQLTINDLNSFNIGDYVVHIDHGIGIFGGLVRLRDDKGRIHEVVKITYKDGDVVFVSVHSLHKISRYRSREDTPPKINKLGSKSWTVLKTNAKSKVKDIAKELIQLYAKRKAIKGFAYSQDSYLQEELESSFMYEDTPDQQEAIRSVKADMENNCPMDRLVCGDVGFGKTEVAIRAAFKAVGDSKQVAVLVPTTILALQHYNTFKNRLSAFPCTIEYVSRLKTTKEISDVKKRLATGQIDILIGTHKILGSSFVFKDLGLLIIDEEQKFGVSAKEKLRQMSIGVDSLTLTATPIPRTLQFSLLGARDLSIINTPPQNRIPVHTEIILFNDDEIKEIIEYELNRGGQVFFLHNKVEELSSIYDILHRLVPETKICVAHGQMASAELEDKMLSFIRGDYDILLCTTIIENGLDIPNANTIIINRAQNIGLSDLHQLRGRVGRSNKQAFCYLIVPPMTTITEDARRRLKAIEEFSDLGSGFNIAMQDLDIRGAGNLLGAEQSGFIMDMGYETYQKILAEAMSELGVEISIPNRSSSASILRECAIETDQPAFIPDEYIDITAEKMRIYKQLDSLMTEKEIDRFREQMQDRFGKLPQEVRNLFTVVKIRNLGATLGFEKIIIKNGMLICFFVSASNTAYFQSERFARIIGNINANSDIFVLKQVDEKLKTVSRGIDSLDKAISVLKKL